MGERMSKKEECRACTGFDDEHTCEGFYDYQEMLKLKKEKILYDGLKYK
jgi:hypothetical protein